MADSIGQAANARPAKAAPSGRLSRRAFMRQAALAGASAAAAVSWADRARAEPRRGGTFRLGIHDANTTDSHDPGTYLTIAAIVLAHTHRSYLTLIEPDGSLGPDVATDWSATPDATEWTFRLNPGVTFHSGRAMTADDVIASMNFHRGEASASAAKALLADVAEIRRDDDLTVTFVMAAGNADLPWLLSDFHLVICPATPDGGIDWQSGDGTGPYRIVSGEMGVGFTLARHEGWHLEGAWFDTVELKMLRDPNARQTALVTGDVDAISAVDLKTMALLARDPGIEIDNVPSASAVTMPMLTDVAPFDDPRVRTALKLAMNRDEIIEKIAFGAAVPGNDFHHAPAMPYYPEGIAQTRYDPEAAKALLAEAGIEDLTVDLSATDSIFSGAVDMAVLYAGQAKAAGITINVVREPADGYYSDVWLKKPWCVVAWGARPTPDVIYSLAYKDDAAWNESRWQNARFNDLLLAAKSELDDARRAEIYREMAELAKEDGGTLIPFFRNFVYAHRATVAHGPELAANWEMDGARACHRWWFAG